MAGETKILSFSEGTAVTAPSQSFLIASSLSVYANDAAYVAAKGSAAAEGDIYANSTDGMIHTYDGTNWKTSQNMKNNFIATAPPGVGDDDADGYEVGSMWLDTTPGIWYICNDASTGAAAWIQVIDGTNPQSIAGIKTFTDTTDASDKDTASVVLEGGLAIEKKIFVGTDATVTGNLAVATIDVTTDIDTPLVTNDSADLTLSTTTSGNINLNSVDNTVLVNSADATNATTQTVKFGDDTGGITGVRNINGDMQYQNLGGGWTSLSSGTGYLQPHLQSDIGLSISMAGNAVTVALKRADGSTDGSAGNPIKIGFRHTTVTTGGFNIRSVTGALSMTIDSGATLGTTSGDSETIYIYALDNAGTVELAASKMKFNEAELQTTTLLDGSADDAYTIYSDVARTTKPIKLIGHFISTQAAAGTWVTSASEVFVGEAALAKHELVAARYDTDSGQSIASATEVIINFDSATFGYTTHSGLVTTGADWKFTANERGKFTVASFILLDSAAWDVGEYANLQVFKNGVWLCHLCFQEKSTSVTAFMGVGGSTTVALNVGDYISVKAYQNSGNAIALVAGEEYNWIAIDKVGL